MAKWPVDTPAKNRASLHVNLTGAAPLSTYFDGPLNVLIQLQGTAQAAIEVEKTKEALPNVVPEASPALDDDEDDDPPG